jgi:cytochrome c biogenesis protein CcmG/thiol:disulfide interchange protein DsbE
MKRPTMIASLTALLVVTLLSVLLVTRRPAQAVIAPSPLLGHAAPPIRGVELMGGTFNLALHRGQVVVVNVWASWCIPCVREAPELSEFAWQQRHHGVILIGVVFNDSLASAKAFSRHYGSLYPSLIDPQGNIANEYGVSAPPITFVIDRHGRVAVVLIGATSAQQLTGVVRRVQS